jgi:cell fate (sporulation/competence/biofilm development) regulator YmcA (YheA/YmcA/DUF963 family)
MESKEKAKELVDRFRNVDYLKDYEGMDEELAQQCAIIAVDEIINSRPAITDSQIDYQEYWQQVKQEIENL